tara:strand:- start:16013 stop:17605 length:1593 start_codon:yes stop_codon:yes gene_type:complete
MSTINNPILKGFNPDPSIIRVGNDYYIATSTFEWFPGVQIHHSKDLKNWKLVARPLNRQSQLNLVGVPDSCGVWAPCLSYSDGVFYLVYSNIHSFDGPWKDSPNYLVTTTDILGDWSEPTYLTSKGFDCSLYHDTDGRKWFLNLFADHRQGKLFGGIEIQEYSLEENKLIGKVKHLTHGTKIGLTEGPHLYKKDGHYYLLVAEGGTEYGHAMSIARSRTIDGLYEFHPENPLISSAEDVNNLLQKAGHGDLVETQNGDWYTVFLVGRPLTTRGRCTLGRETAIEEIVWKDNWPYLKNGGRIPRVKIPESSFPEFIHKKDPVRIDFNQEKLPIDFQSLRIPVSENWCSLSARPGFLRLYGKQSLSSFHQQSLLARRVQSFNMEASTAIEFLPTTPQQMAGLIFYYNTGHYHYAHISANYEGNKRFLSIISADNFEMQYQEELVEVTDHDKIILKGNMNRDKLQFYYSLGNETHHKLGIGLDASILSDDYVKGTKKERPFFTGSFVGVCCQDLAMNRHHADFEWFEYKELEV